MTAIDVTYDHVLALARRLPPVDQARLVVQLAPTIEQLLPQPRATVPGRVPLRGLLSDLGVAPSATDIADVQRDMWASIGNNAE